MKEGDYVNSNDVALNALATHMTPSKYNRPTDIEGLTFVKTNERCPERYEVYTADGCYVGNVNLRLGELSCEVAINGGQLVYFGQFNDQWMGSFMDDNQRSSYLRALAMLVNTRIKRDEEAKAHASNV